MHILEEEFKAIRPLIRIRNSYGHRGVPDLMTSREPMNNPQLEAHWLRIYPNLPTHEEFEVDGTVRGWVREEIAGQSKH